MLIVSTHWSGSLIQFSMMRQNTFSGELNNKLKMGTPFFRVYFFKRLMDTVLGRIVLIFDFVRKRLVHFSSAWRCPPLHFHDLAGGVGVFAIIADHDD